MNAHRVPWSTPELRSSLQNFLASSMVMKKWPPVALPHSVAV